MKKPIILAAILAILTACNQSTEKDTADYPNIIYVLADDLGYGDISTFNENSKIPTPHIDQLAEEGMKFTDAHTTSAVCTPTRYGILTGRYNWRSTLKNGVAWGHSRSLIPAGRATVASMLQEMGYHTAFIGKWHLGWDWATKAAPANEEKRWSTKILDTIDFSKPVTLGPNELGFSYSFGHVASLDMPPYVYVENGVATQIPEKETVDEGKYTWWRKGPTSDDFIHEEVTPVFFNKTMDHVREMAQKEKPFFIYLALPSPHTPILPTEEWLGKSGLNPYADFMMEIDDYMGQLMRTIK
ncbi:MAG: sulfatase-like hydrolase/transferase, partial [Bacteroidales bacterium]|nr:sulfatase-like hydrolase/transferase [Bacteroidales bacterium]